MEEKVSGVGGLRYWASVRVSLVTSGKWRSGAIGKWGGGVAVGALEGTALSRNTRTA